MNWYKISQSQSQSQKPKGKLFGSEAQRVSSSEFGIVFEELKDVFSDVFLDMKPSRFLPSKKDHGDIDILVLAEPNINLKSLLPEKLGERLKRVSKNGNIYSFLYISPSLGKTVHVDFILSTKKEDHSNRVQFYSYNDFSAVIGIIARKLNFKYGTEGFFKRFQDKKGIWHDILITQDLMKGLRILGYDPSGFSKIQNPEDIVKFAISSPLFNTSMLAPEGFACDDRQSEKRRPGFTDILCKIRETNINNRIQDEDFFLKTLYPLEYQKVEEEKKALNEKTYAQSKKYDGHWIMMNFGLKPGKQIGLIMKSLYNKYGDKIEDIPEVEVKDFVKKILDSGLHN